MNFRLRRFLETTSPMIIGYGIVIALTTKYFGINIAITSILIFSMVDIVMLKKGERR